ncbi:PC-Esterase protein [Dioscorea alata]|uniref:PC-Esterase protein n=1 Tax=Dioscorea alata TaxID=55571 RepID=A0ACB7VTL6_DIOAL|nr:PC-Esterase protein [Dioscorea alata]
MKLPKCKLPFSVTAILITSMALASVIFTENLRALTGTSIFKLKACPKENVVPALYKDTSFWSTTDDIIDEDKIEFDPNECRIMDGEWVFNRSVEPLYTDETCPYLDRDVACQRNGRIDRDYLYWQWQLDDCILPRFDPEKVLEKLRGKRLMFVGDSVQKAQWLSFVCMVQSRIPEDQRSMHRTHTFSVFRAKGYNASIEFYWAPHLVETNSDDPIIYDTKKRILHVDSVSKHAKNWVGVDILVFNSYVWWMNGHKIKSLWGSFANGEEGYEELETKVAYRISLKTWANWVDSTVNPNVTRVFFNTMSPTHMRSKDWNNTKGIRCYNETMPVMKKGHWGSGSNRTMMKVVSDIVGRMKFPLTVINITQLSEHRIDGHVSVHTGGKIPLEEKKANLRQFVDCIHWCLPGVPDAWNQIFAAYL